MEPPRVEHDKDSGMEPPGVGYEKDSNGASIYSPGVEQVIIHENSCISPDQTLRTLYEQ